MFNYQGTVKGKSHKSMYGTISGTNFKYMYGTIPSNLLQTFVGINAFTVCQTKRIQIILLHDQVENKPHIIVVSVDIVYCAMQ